MHIATLTIHARGCYRLHHWREFNLAIFYDSPNRQIKVLAKFSRYTVCAYYEMATPTIAKIWRAQARRCIFILMSFAAIILTRMSGPRQSLEVA